jgi:small multidrug resistance family-3 protein
MTSCCRQPSIALYPSPKENFRVPMNEDESIPISNRLTEQAVDATDESFQWTAVTIIQALALFVAAGVAEIGGGWLVWKAIRSNKPWWWAVLGSLVLVLYGFLPTLQPTDSFGRVYAVYGGFFIVLSFLAGWLLDGDKPDKGDVIGGSISLAGVLLILFWPR